MTLYRIHGDNVVESERALELIGAALEGRLRLVGSAPYAPQYQVVKGDEVLGTFELVPGYGRWPVDLVEYFRSRGSPLREATDAIVTRCSPGVPFQETPLFALEFCGALPAGNNAWQRCGRALACAYAAVPYLYFAEIGGLELDANRNPKAPRFPNPVVPFAYLTMGKALGSVSAPVFAHSPSGLAALTETFAGTFGERDALQAVSALLRVESANEAIARLATRALLLTKTLAATRTDTLRGDDWDHVALADSPAAWFADRKMRWRKTVTIRTTATFGRLLELFTARGFALGSEDMPFCVIPAAVRTELAEAIGDIYGERLSPAMRRWLAGEGPLVVVWVCGFKPKGDDSRPDRGLVPLARMLVGERPDLLTVVYGPATKATWTQFTANPGALSAVNGLWEALLGLSGALLVDSRTAPPDMLVGHIVTRPPLARREVPLSSTALMTPTFGEHDVDTTLHLLFGSALVHGVFEGLCNPPGGDWSGLSYHDFASDREFRWTSLPRVSGEGTKRPDHVAQFRRQDADVLLAIESKESGGAVEDGIGPRLTGYVESLMATTPNISRQPVGTAWSANRDALPQVQRRHLSAAAFLFHSRDELARVLQRAQVDAAIGVAFNSAQGKAVLHVLARDQDWLAQKLAELSQLLLGRVEVQVY